jgi:hypothetical protein
MAPAVLHRVCLASSEPTDQQRFRLVSHPARLLHHRRYRIKDHDYPAVIPCEQANATVLGSLATAPTDEDMNRLDIFEGKEYGRRQVIVEILDKETGGMDQAECEIYIWIAADALLDKCE